MKDFTKTTAWFDVPSEKLIGKITYGFSCIEGNSGPYFSITGEAWKRDERAYARGELKPRGRDGVMFGQCHDTLIPCSPHSALFKRAAQFHLFDPNEGPMHYTANALYWLEEFDKSVEVR